MSIDSMDEDTAFLVKILLFIILGSISIKAAEWFFINIITPIGEIVEIFEWMSRIPQMTPVEILSSFITLYVLILIGKWIVEYTKSHFKFGLFWEELGGTWGGRFKNPDGNHYEL